MERLIGSQVVAHLKFDEIINGVLLDTDERHVYLQGDVGSLIAIPRENVKYYIVNSTGLPEKKIRQPNPDSPKDTENTLLVYVDDDAVACIEIPEGLDITNCNEHVLKLIWADEDVQNSVRGKIQRSLEYDVGVAHITTLGAQEDEPTTGIHPSFTMGAGGVQPATPFEMAKNLSVGGKR